MSLLGKVFVILNVFGVLGVLFVAAMDYGKRHAWAYAVFRQDLAIGGLPLDDTVRDTEGNLIAERIGEQTQKELFPQNPVTTQVAEVQRVQALYKSQASAVSGRKALAFYATFLLPFAQTNTERQRLRAYQVFLSDDKKADDLKKEFAAAWAEAAKLQPPPKEAETKMQPREAAIAALDARHLESARPFVDVVLEHDPKAVPGPDGAQALDKALDAQSPRLAEQMDAHFQDALREDTKPQPPPAPQQIASSELRRQRIALLLFNVYGSLQEWAAGGQATDDNKNLEDVPDYRRLLTVVGLREGARAVQAEATALGALVSAVETARHRERSLFAVHHEKLLGQIRDRATQVEAENAVLARKTQQQRDHEVELKKRKRDVKQYTEDWDAAKRDTAKDLAELRKLSDTLFKERLKLRDDTEENQKLEKEIRALEKDR
jgi:hypothetical protein